jgi:broad specificity phosphatase PhoE
LRNENEAREWFRAHPHVHLEFEKMNYEMVEKMRELQQRARNGLQQIVVQERDSVLFNVNKKRVKMDK